MSHIQLQYFMLKFYFSLSLPPPSAVASRPPATEETVHVKQPSPWPTDGGGRSVPLAIPPPNHGRRPWRRPRRRCGRRVAPVADAEGRRRGLVDRGRRGRTPVDDGNLGAIELGYSADFVTYRNQQLESV